jgi:hypothetical protein
MSLPLLPHCDLDPECCGCLFQVVIDEETRFKCNEWNGPFQGSSGTPYPRNGITEAVRPHCGKMNEISGFSEVFAFRCRFCGEGVSANQGESLG